MAKNKNLHSAKKAKCDEFYTQLSDIENELQHYEQHFKDKVIYLNCDAEWSNFYLYFKINQERLGIKKLLRSNYDATTGLGDFRSDEAIELLKECDIVVTNPPFSLFREFIDLMFEYDKKFLVIGNKNAATNDKNIFKFVLERKLWLGLTTPQDFIQPEGADKKNLNGLTKWFTNLDYKKRHESMFLYCNYTPDNYSFYDNTNIINVDKTKDIPCDWRGVMGIPISALSKINPKQFEIIGMCNDGYFRGNVECKARINGKGLYARLLVKLKNQTNENTTETN